MGIMDEQEIIRNFRKGFEAGMKAGMKSETLRRADEIIHGERQDQYGDPEDSFKLIAEYWSMYLRSRLQEIVHYCDIPDDMLINLGAQDTAIMLALMKIARMSGQKWHKDNAVDACGYLAILNDRIKSEG
jgi:hypothetical protein